MRIWTLTALVTFGALLTGCASSGVAESVVHVEPAVAVKAPAEEPVATKSWNVICSTEKQTVVRCGETGEEFQFRSGTGRVIDFHRQGGTTVVLFSGSMQAQQSQPVGNSGDAYREYVIERDPVTGERQLTFRGAVRKPDGDSTPAPTLPSVSPAPGGRR